MAMNKDGGYVFISHSHKDIEKVRQIRNEMEAEGFEPLCFYLKCLCDEDEIEGLIKREIDAREWFVFVESPNSLSSKWVQKERNYISSKKDKQIIRIDLNNESSLHDVAQRLMRTLRVYIAFSKEDEAFVEILKKRLIDRDYQVLTGLYHVASEYTYNMCFMDNCENIEKSGCMLAVISKDSVKDHYFREELYYAYERKINVVPIYMDGLSSEGLEIQAEKGRVPLEKSIEDADSSSAPKDFELTRILIAMQNANGFDIREALAKATSHNEIMQYEWRFSGDEEVAKLCQEAHDRLDSDPDY